MGCSNIAYPKLVIELMPDGEKCGAGLQQRGWAGSARGNQAALTHPKDVEILLQIPDSRREKTVLRGPRPSPDSSSVFCCRRAPGFDDCSDDGSPDEFPHLGFQQQQHPLRDGHLAAHPQARLRAGADDCGKVLAFIYVSFLSSSVLSAASAPSRLDSLRKIWCLQYRAGAELGKEHSVF